MQQRKIVEDYLSSIIPDKIADSTKAELREEIEGHIYDKAEFYMEIGYDEETAFKKAVAEMGEAEPVRKEFESIYKDSTIIAYLTSIGVLACNFIAFIKGFAYFTVDTGDIPTAFYVFLSTLFSSVVLCIIFDARNKRLKKRLEAILFSTGLMLLFAMLTNAIFQPMFYGLGLNITYVTEAVFGKQIDGIAGALAPVGAFFFLVLLVVFSLIKRRRTVNVKILSLVLAVFTVMNTFGYCLSYDKYIYFYDPLYEPDTVYTEQIQKHYDCYETINSEMTFEQADKFLREKGYVSQIEYIDYAKKLDEEYGESFYYADALEETEEILKENLWGKQGSLYCSKEMAEEQLLDECIIISEDLSLKTYIIDDAYVYYAEGYERLSDMQKITDCFLSFKKGDSKNSVDESIKDWGLRTFERELTVDGKIITEYKFRIEAYEPIDTFRRYFDGGVPYEEIELDIYLRFENGALTDGTADYTNYGSEIGFTKETFALQ